MSPTRKNDNKVKPASGPVALLIGTRKGAFILRGDKTRHNWKMTNRMFIGATIHHMVMDPRDGGTILMTAVTGHLGPTVYRSTDQGKTWKEATKPPAFPQAASGEKGLVLDHNFWLSPGHPSEPDVWYLGSSPSSLFRSEDGGSTWEGVKGFNDHPKRTTWVGGGDPPDGATLHSILIDPRDLNHMYIGLSAGGVFESIDKGADWKPLNQGLVSQFLESPTAEYGHDPHLFRLHPLQPDRLYQQNHEGIYRMDRDEGKWVRIGTNLPEQLNDHGFPIVLHPRDPETVWVFPVEGFPQGRVPHEGKPAVYETNNGGKTWKRKSKGMPKSDGWFTVKRQGMTADTHDPVGVYFGTTGGEVWASLDEGASWSRLATSLPEIYSVEAAELAR
ncbi:MAG: WD40/YVTN/BNR-like repeat-containing protein [Acidobacteriota bacterium]